MPRKEGQKRKLLVLLEILARETDEKHPLSVPQLVEELQEHGVVARHVDTAIENSRPHVSGGDGVGTDAIFGERCGKVT